MESKISWPCESWRSSDEWRRVFWANQLCKVGGRFKYCIVLLYRKLRYDICVFMRMESLQCLVVFRYNPPHVCFFQNLGFATSERSGDASGEGGLRWAGGTGCRWRDRNQERWISGWLAISWIRPADGCQISSQDRSLMHPDEFKAAGTLD